MANGISISPAPRNYKVLLVIVSLIALSIIISFFIAAKGTTLGFIILALLIALPVVFQSFINVEFGFYVSIAYSFLLFILYRLLSGTVPTGIGLDALAVILFAGIFTSEIRSGKTDWSYFKNPVTYLFIASQLYNILQGLNPNAVSLTGWTNALRAIFIDSILYFVFVKVMVSLDVIKRFTKLWLFLAFLAALYSIKQEIFGYADFEWRDIYSNPATLGLIQNWGILRKFSFLSDVALFGITMAVAGILCSVLATGPYSLKWKIVLIISAAFMFVGMSFSGTRTATVIVPVGFMIYVLMNINNKSTLIVLFVVIIAFGAVMFGPFYGGAISRVRTAFNPSQDASMSVREINRARIQPYLQTHPIGGGPNTTDIEGERLAPGHPLAGFPTDSGFLKTGLTIGWIGLILNLVFYFVTIATGVINYYKAKSPLIRNLYLAYVAAFFALIIANYAQPAIGQKPIAQLVFAIFTIMPNMIRFDETES